jgi:ABC-2 type transport system ATP-binding protein
MIACTGLHKAFKEKVAVANLSFEVRDGELFGLLGANGAGKTTTIKMILGLLPIDGGEVHIVDGVKVGYSPETPFFAPFLTGRETLTYYAKLQKLPKAGIGNEVTRILKLVGLDDDKTKVGKYSKGMSQRLAVGQALLGDPDLLILDEPTAGLDALGRIEMMRLLQQLKGEGKSILLNSHILSDVERICDRAVILRRGEVVREWEHGDDEGLEQVFLEAVGASE